MQFNHSIKLIRQQFIYIYNTANKIEFNFYLPIFIENNKLMISIMITNSMLYNDNFNDTIDYINYINRYIGTYSHLNMYHASKSEHGIEILEFYFKIKKSILLSMI